MSTTRTHSPCDAITKSCRFLLVKNTNSSPHEPVVLQKTFWYLVPTSTTLALPIPNKRNARVRNSVVSVTIKWKVLPSRIARACNWGDLLPARLKQMLLDGTLVARATSGSRVQLTRITNLSRAHRPPHTDTHKPDTPPSA